MGISVDYLECIQDFWVFLNDKLVQKHVHYVKQLIIMKSVGGIVPRHYTLV